MSEQVSEPIATLGRIWSEQPTFDVPINAQPTNETDIASHHQAYIVKLHPSLDLELLLTPIVRLAHTELTQVIAEIKQTRSIQSLFNVQLSIAPLELDGHSNLWDFRVNYQLSTKEL